MIAYRRGKHSVSVTLNPVLKDGVTHLVFVVKYRKKIFTGEHIDYMREVFKQVGEKMDFKVLEMNGEKDHVHLLLEYPPKLSISKIVNSLKGVSSRMLRKKFPQLAKMKSLWSPSYFAVSCGGTPSAKIKEYIENQQKPLSS